MTSSATAEAGDPSGRPVRRVLMTADTVGGVWTYSLQLARALRTRGTDVTFAIMGEDLTQTQVAESSFSSYRHPGRLEWMDSCWNDVESAGDWLLELEREVKPDIVHINGYVHASLNWSAPSLIVAHSCVLSWWEAVHEEPAPGEWNVYRERVHEGLNAASIIVAPSKAMLNSLDTNYGVPAGKSRVIYNGLEFSQTTNLQKKDLIFAAGRVWDKAKNLAILDRIAERLTFPVEIAGDFGKKSPCSSARYLGLLPSDQVQSRMQSASIFTSPATYEPFGLAVLEAARASCALVLSDIPTFREIWGESATYVSPGSDEQWTLELNRLAADPALIRHFGNRAQQRSLKYSSQSMADQYLTTYKEMLQ